MVARIVRDDEVAGSNPAVPTHRNPAPVAGFRTSANPGFSTSYAAPRARGMEKHAYPGFSTSYAAPRARGMAGPETCVLPLEQQLRELDRIQCGTLAKVVGDDPEADPATVAYGLAHPANEHIVDTGGVQRCRNAII